MNRVNRPMPPPNPLNGESSMGGRETARWKAYYEKKRSTKPGKFSAYNEEEVQLALREMFKNKCGYCERRIPSGDVEHYRPKNAVTRKDGTKLAQGYWWLAADWDNLLWSCPSCNQRRKVEIEGEEGLQTKGKGTKFPIAKDVVVNKPGDEKNEDPLLLNPVIDVPEEHMRIKTIGKADFCCIQAVVDQNGKKDLKGFTTIDILGLNNITTVADRIDKLSGIKERMWRIEKLNLKMNRLSHDEEWESLKDEKEEEIDKLKQMLEPDQEYLLLARQLIPEFIDQQAILEKIYFQMRVIERLGGTMSALSPGAERDALKLELREELKKLSAFVKPGQPHLEKAKETILPFVNKLTGG